MSPPQKNRFGCAHSRVGRLPELVAEEVLVHFVEGEFVGLLHPDPIGEHQLGQLDPVDEDDFAVPVAGGGLSRAW